jgi:hypothetical protein
MAIASGRLMISLEGGGEGIRAKMLHLFIMRPRMWWEGPNLNQLSISMKRGSRGEEGAGDRASPTTTKQMLRDGVRLQGSRACCRQGGWIEGGMVQHLLQAAMLHVRCWTFWSLILAMKLYASLCHCCRHISVEPAKSAEELLWMTSITSISLRAMVPRRATREGLNITRGRCVESARSGTESSKEASESCDKSPLEWKAR